MIVEVKDLTKRFIRSRNDAFTAVDGIEFSIAPGIP